jgi:hypothetical protein
VPGRPKCCAIAHIAMNSRVEPLVICGPLSETASRIGGSSGSSTAASKGKVSAGTASRRASTSASSPSSSSASRNTTWTWVEVSSIDTSSQIHLRVTRSITANTACRGQSAKCTQS